MQCVSNCISHNSKREFCGWLQVISTVAKVRISKHSWRIVQGFKGYVLNLSSKLINNIILLFYSYPTPTFNRHETIPNTWIVCWKMPLISIDQPHRMHNPFPNVDIPLGTVVNSNATAAIILICMQPLCNEQLFRSNPHSHSHTHIHTFTHTHIYILTSFDG